MGKSALCVDRTKEVMGVLYMMLMLYDDVMCRVCDLLAMKSVRLRLTGYDAMCDFGC